MKSKKERNKAKRSAKQLRSEVLIWHTSYSGQLLTTADRTKITCYKSMKSFGFLGFLSSLFDTAFRARVIFLKLKKSITTRLDEEVLLPFFDISKLTTKITSCSL